MFGTFTLSRMLVELATRMHCKQNETNAKTIIIILMTVIIRIILVILVILVITITMTTTTATTTRKREKGFYLFLTWHKDMILY